MTGVAPVVVAIVKNVDPMFRKDLAKPLCEQILFCHAIFLF